MDDSENNPENYKTQKISIGAMIKSPEMLTLFLDHLKTKKMCKNAVKRLSFVLKYAPDQYKTKKMCGKVIIENGGMLQ